MIVPGYAQFGGTYSETAAVRNLLAHLGVVAPHTGQPFTEAMLFGISGGIGFTYFSFEYTGYAPSLYLGVAHRYKIKYGLHMDGLYHRLGIGATAKKTGSIRVATKDLREAIKQEQPVILHVADGQAPWFSEGGYHALVVYGYDEAADQVLIADRASVPLEMSSGNLAAARSGFAPLKNRSTTLVPPPTMPNLKGAIEAGIRICCDAMINPPIPVNNFGLPGLRKWARRVNNPMDKKGWPKLFQPGAELYSALHGTFMYIEIGETGGGALRGMYADFLTEAIDVLGNPGLEAVAQKYQSAAQLWRDLAHTALPDSVLLFKETKDLAYRRQRLFIENGMAALPEIEAINDRAADITATMADSFPLSAKRSQQLLEALHRRIQRVFDAEKEAIEALQAIVEP